MDTGADLKQRPPHVPGPGPDNDILQVMPWPAYSKMTDREKRAIYEYPDGHSLHPRPPWRAGDGQDGPM